MAGPFPAQSNPGAFIPTTDNYDTSVIYSLDINSDEFKEFLVRLRQSINNVALSLNIKDTGYYPLTEFVNSQAYFPDPTLTSSTAATPVLRQVFRLVVNIGALGAGVTTVAHGLTITNKFTFTRIYATASDTIGNNYYPIPWASAAGATNIELRVNATNVIITNNSGVAFNFCYCVLEYIKQ